MKQKNTKALIGTLQVITILYRSWNEIQLKKRLTILRENCEWKNDVIILTREYCKKNHIPGRFNYQEGNTRVIYTKWASGSYLIRNQYLNLFREVREMAMLSDMIKTYGKRVKVEIRIAEDSEFLGLYQKSKLGKIETAFLGYKKGKLVR